MTKRTTITFACFFLALLQLLPCRLAAQQWKSVISPDSAQTSDSVSGGAGFVAPGGDSSAQLAAMATKYANAVGLVVFVFEGRQPVPCATAWAVAPNLFATNAHVVKGIQNAKEKGAEAFIALNKQSDKRFRVTGAKIHPKFGSVRLGFDGQSSFGGSYDVALLAIDGRVGVWFPLAGVNELKRLDSGYRVAYLGFPMEDLEHGNVNVFSPVATLKTGIVTSMTDYTQGDGGFGSNYLIHHDMGSAGGASGSPIFNTRGEVVGLHSAGNYEMVVKLVQLEAEQAGEGIKVEPKIDRVPSAAMVNFGQRVDLLYELLEN